MTSREYEKIRPDKITELYAIGFKVVPIAADGFTPCVSWGRIYENGWDETELVKTEFANVATCFGKSHIKDENKQDYYLNCLDIDSKEVFDRLYIILDKNKKERFLLSQLRKLTYVTQTRKEYGLHLYWSSHRPNVPIQRNDCKLGFEFEIKTDKSSGLAALPPSRHRDEVDFHYRNIGQNNIMISDSLYGEIVRILDDCIKKQGTPSPCEVTISSRQLNEREIEKISGTISSLYMRGFRHEICYAISGILYKNGIGLETTSKIINAIGKGDEELKSRLAVMRHTYSKDVSEVSGRRQLLETLKSLCKDDKQAVYEHLSILKILNPYVYESTKIEHNKIAEELIQEYHFCTMEDTEELFYYDDISHRYTNHGEVLIRKELEQLFPEISTRNVNEILQKIKRKNPVSRAEFDTSPFINVENGLLNPLTGDFIPHCPKMLTLNQLPVTFDPNAKCPRILKFLSQVLRPCDIFTLIQFVGYCLSKTSKYEKSLFLLGLGDNGKSVLLKLLEAFVGLENLSHVSLRELSEDRFAKAELFGKMANTCGDLESYRVLDTSTFKQLVSGDTVRAQKKGQHAFSFRNHARLIFSSNQFPVVADGAYSWYKRIIVLVFPNTFTDSRDVDMIDKITTPEELSGLLNLVIMALRQLIKTGHFANEEDPRKVRQYFDKGLKSVQEFVKNKCIRGSCLSECSLHLYDAYCQYCKSNQITPLADSTFGACLKDLGIKKVRPMVAGVRNYVYVGIKLK